jgi:hypothetical protein
MMVMTAMLIVHCAGGYVSSLSMTFPFRDKVAATDALEAITAAVKAHKARSNDREDIVQIETMTGSASIDITNFIGAAVDAPDPEVDDPVLTEWQRRMRAINGRKSDPEDAA